MKKPESTKIKGRGAQFNPHNPYHQLEQVREHWEGIDENEEEAIRTEYIETFPKSIVNQVASPDVGMSFSLNPYQGCEHGCIYCYARNTHNYWGYSAGSDFEQKILIKKNAPQLLAKELSRGEWEPCPILLSGNTDCYQPAERKFGITRKLLQVFLDFRHPVGIITKNTLLLRDLDLLKELNRLRLVHVTISFTSLNEDLRRVMEPRTSSVATKLKTIEALSQEGIPVNVMMAPIIPSINSHEIFELSRMVANAGALSIHHTVVRLNDAIGPLFSDWIRMTFPERAEKVLSQIKSLHGGELGDKRKGVRMKGEGNLSRSISDQFALARTRYFSGREMPAYDLGHFIRRNNSQLLLF